MNKLSLSVFLLSSLLAATACSPKNQAHTKMEASVPATATPVAAAKPTAPTPSTAPTKPADKPAPAKVASLAGTYTNGSGAILTISAYVPTKGFDFALKITTKDDCNGVDYTGKAKFTGKDQAQSSDDDVFKITKKGLQVEPSTSNVGMGCLRVIDVAFTRKK